MPKLVNADALADRLEALAYDDWNKGAITTWANALEDFAEMVRDEREVKAIPVEWIEKYLEKWKNTETYDVAYTWWLIIKRKWEKENAGD